MKPVTAAYWIPITVERLDMEPKRHEGLGGEPVESIDYWYEQTIDYFTDIYGNVVDAYWFADTIGSSYDDNYLVHTNFVITGFVEGEAHLEDSVYDAWPIDFIEQMNQAKEKCDLSNIVGYDLNPPQNEPINVMYRGNLR